MPTTRQALPFRASTPIAEASALGTRLDCSPHTEHTEIAAAPDLATQPPTEDAAVTADVPTDATVDAYHCGAPPQRTDFLASEPAATDKPLRRRRSPGPHERRMPGVPADSSTSDCDGNPRPSDDARSTD